MFEKSKQVKKNQQHLFESILFIEISYLLLKIYLDNCTSLIVYGPNPAVSIDRHCIIGFYNEKWEFSLQLRESHHFTVQSKHRAAVGHAVSTVCAHEFFKAWHSCGIKKKKKSENVEMETKKARKHCIHLASYWCHQRDTLTFDRVVFLDHLLLRENVRRQSAPLCPKLCDYWVMVQCCSSAQ